MTGHDSDDGGLDEPLIEPPIILAITGTGASERLIGTAAAETLNGRAGDDTLAGGGGADTLQGGDGNDLFVVALGGSLIRGGAGFDTADFQASAVPVYAAPRTDEASDFTELRSIERVFGSAFADRIEVDGRSNWVSGLAGDDLIIMGASVNNGAAGVEYASGGPGRDTLIGGAGEDQMWGNQGDDQLRGGADGDLLRGRAGADTLWGGPGSDDLAGGRGEDRLLGGEGDDWLRGRAGDDHLQGGPGNDQFRFVSAADEGADVIADFQMGEDRIAIHTNLSRSAPGVTADDIRLRVDGEDLVIDYGDALTASIRVLDLAKWVDDLEVQVF